MKALCFGEVLWDIIDGVDHLGGAPFNLAAHLAKLGADSAIVTRLGNDDRGRRVLQRMSQLCIDRQWVQTDPEHPTGYVTVFLSEAGHANYTIHEGVAWDHIEADPRMAEEIRGTELDVFCFGTLSQRSPQSRESLVRLLDNVQAAHVFYDVNLRQNYYTEDVIRWSLKRSTILKLNDDESVVLDCMLYGSADYDERRFTSALIDEFGLDIAIVTKGPEGCSVYTNEAVTHWAGIPGPVADTVGAGDAFSAGFLWKLQRGDTPAAAADFANHLGTFVSTHTGAIADYSPEILELAARTPEMPS